MSDFLLSTPCQQIGSRRSCRGGPDGGGDDDDDTPRNRTHSFIGDIHQPLHASRASDRGGNDIDVRYHLLDGNGTSPVLPGPSSEARPGLSHSHSHHHHRTWNLHSVWDTALIETVMERDCDGNRSTLEAGLLRLLEDHPEWVGRYLECSHGSGARNSTCVEGWGRESWHLALEFAYTRNVPEQPGGAVVEVADGDELDEGYYATRLPVVKERLVAGGVRLAATLEEIFGGGGPGGDAAGAGMSTAVERSRRDVPTKNLAQGLESLRMWSSVSSMW